MGTLTVTNAYELGRRGGRQRCLVVGVRIVEAGREVTYILHLVRSELLRVVAALADRLEYSLSLFGVVAEVVFVQRCKVAVAKCSPIQKHTSCRLHLAGTALLSTSDAGMRKAPRKRMPL